MRTGCHTILPDEILWRRARAVPGAYCGAGKVKALRDRGTETNSGWETSVSALHLHSALEAFLTWAWNASLSASILVLLLLLVQLVLGKLLRARWLYALWLCVLVRLLMPVVPGSKLSALNLVGRLHRSEVMDRPI